MGWHGPQSGDCSCCGVETVGCTACSGDELAALSYSIRFDGIIDGTNCCSFDLLEDNEFIVTGGGGEDTCTWRYDFPSGTVCGATYFEPTREIYIELVFDGNSNVVVVRVTGFSSTTPFLNFVITFQKNSGGAIDCLDFDDEEIPFGNIVSSNSFNADCDFSSASAFVSVA